MLRCAMRGGDAMRRAGSSPRANGRGALLRIDGRLFPISRRERCPAEPVDPLDDLPVADAELAGHREASSKDLRPRRCRHAIRVDDSVVPLVNVGVADLEHLGVFANIASEHLHELGPVLRRHPRVVHPPNVIAHHVLRRQFMSRRSSAETNDCDDLLRGRLRAGFGAVDRLLASVCHGAGTL